MAEESTQNINKEVKIKQKNPKRVEQGKKLVELNRKNKKEVHAQEVPAEEVFSHEQTTRKVSKQVDSLKLNSLLLGGTFVIIGALYFTNRETQFVPEQAQEKAPPQVQEKALPKILPDAPTHDPFVMDFFFKKISIYKMDPNTTVNGMYLSAIISGRNNKFFAREKTSQS